MDVAAAESPARCVRERLVTLKRRSDFLGIRSGARGATRAFVLEGRRRDATEGGAARVGTADDAAPRFGFTVSKKVGGAVERNRIKRRLKDAVRDILLDHARPNYDYVLIARRPALDAAYAALVSDLVDALKRVHARSERPERTRASSKG